MLVPAARGHYKGSLEFLEGVSPATPSDPRPSHCMKLYYTLSRSYASTPTMPLSFTTNTAAGREALRDRGISRGVSKGIKRVRCCSMRYEVEGGLVGFCLPILMWMCLASSIHFYLKF